MRLDHTFPLRIALAALVLLLVASLTGNFFQLLHAWELAEARDARPAGDFFRSRQELPVYVRGGSSLALTLPTGVLLQESTPRRVATLGKFYGREFLLTVHSAAFARPDALEVARSHEPPHFEAPYSFEPGDRAP